MARLAVPWLLKAVFALAAFFGLVFILDGLVSSDTLSTTIGGAILGQLAILTGFAELIQRHGQMQMDAIDRVAAELQAARLRGDVDAVIGSSIKSGREPERDADR